MIVLYCNDWIFRKQYLNSLRYSSLEILAVIWDKFCDPAFTISEQTGIFTWLDFGGAWIFLWRLVPGFSNLLQLHTRGSAGEWCCETAFPEKPAATMPELMTCGDDESIAHGYSYWICIFKVHYSPLNILWPTNKKSISNYLYVLI